jgi:hypothetical protein
VAAASESSALRTSGSIRIAMVCLAIEYIVTRRDTVLERAR